MLEEEESAEAVRREFEWQSGQTCKSGTQFLRGETDEIWDDPDADEDGEDEDESLEEALRNALKRPRGVLYMGSV
jgi:hypothetical protein